MLLGDRVVCVGWDAGGGDVMGWCSATVIFDAVCDGLLAKRPPSKASTVRQLIAALEDGDWDCQQDSEYWSHPIVRAAMKELHPDWDWDDIEGNEK